MLTPQEMALGISTRRDFRQAIESGQQQQCDKQIRRDRLIDVWAALSDAYGNAFANQFGDEPNQTWADGLANYSDEQILQAVGVVITKGGEFAPNLNSIIRAITANSDWRHAASRITAQEAVSQPRVDRGVGRLIEHNPADPNKTPADYMAEMKGKF